MFADLLRHGGLSLDRLQSFCEVAAAGGLTKAANGDPARQSLFSRQVKELEQFFGVELVHRKGRGIALTPVGERLHLLAREQLLALSDFKSSATGQTIELTITAGDSLIQWILLPQLGAIRAKLPNVNLRVLNLPTAEIATRLRDGLVDLALLRADSVTRPLKSSPLGTMTFSLFIPSRMWSAAKSKAMSADQLARVPIATLEGAGQFRQELRRLSELHEQKLNLQLELSSFPLVACAVATGEYAAVLPSISRSELLRSGANELKPEFLRPLSRQIVLAWNPRMARVRSVVDQGIKIFGNLVTVS
jgi:DNA-binding transcriptional LysR family regulator